MGEFAARIGAPRRVASPPGRNCGRGKWVELEAYGEVSHFPSANACARATGLPVAAIRRACRYRTTIVGTEVQARYIQPRVRSARWLATLTTTVHWNQLLGLRQIAVEEGRSMSDLIRAALFDKYHPEDLYNRGLRSPNRVDESLETAEARYAAELRNNSHLQKGRKGRRPRIFGKPPLPDKRRAPPSRETQRKRIERCAERWGEPVPATPPATTEPTCAD